MMVVLQLTLSSIPVYLQSDMNTPCLIARREVQYIHHQMGEEDLVFKAPTTISWFAV